MYKIILPIHYEGKRYGIDFKIDREINRGVGYTDNERIAGLMKNKGFITETVTEIKLEKKKETEGEKDMPATELSKIKARDAALNAKAGKTGKTAVAAYGIYEPDNGELPETITNIKVDNDEYEAKADELPPATSSLPPSQVCEGGFAEESGSGDKNDGGTDLGLTEEEQKVVEKRKTARTQKKTGE